MKKLLLAIVMAIALAISVSAQTEPVWVIGDTTSTTKGIVPVNLYYMDGYSQTLYLASEMQAGVITSIAYQYDGAPATDNVKLYMAETDRVSFTGAGDWVPGTELEQVFQGQVSYSQGWVNISLSTPFIYSGEGNLVVGYVSDRSSYESVGDNFIYSPTAAIMSIIDYGDNLLYDVNNTSISYSAHSYSHRPNTKFGMFASLDDICFAPSEVTISNISTDGANVSWTCDDEDATFSVAYKLATETEWTPAETGVPMGTITLSGLTSLSLYQVKVAADCSEDGLQEVIVDFVTLPSDDNFITLPYSQNFDVAEDITNWTFVNTTENAWVFGTAVNGTYEEGLLTEGGALYISNDNGVTNTFTENVPTIAFAYAMLNFQEGSNYGISFDWKCEGEGSGSWIYDYLQVFLLPTNYNFTNSLPTNGAITAKLNGASSWQSAVISVPDTCVGNSYALAFVWRNDSYGGAAPAAVDNVSIISSSCGRVSDVTSELETDESGTVTATLSIVDPNEGASFFVEYRIAGDEIWTSLESESTTVVLTDLVPAATYEVRVTANCEGENALMSDVFRFATPCLSISTFPYVQGFGGEFEINAPISNEVAPLCWYNINGGVDYYGWTKQEEYNALYYAGYNSDYEIFSDWVITNPFVLTGEQQVNCKVRFSSYYNDIGSPAIKIYALNVAENDIALGADTSLFTYVGSIVHNATNTEYTDYVLDISTLTGTYRLALVINAPAGSFFLDDFTVENIPDCQPVYGLSALPMSATGVKINFTTSPEEEGFVIAYEEAIDNTPFDPETAETYDVTSVDELPVIIEDLTQGATYNFAVKRTCEGATFSTVVSVTLPSSAITPPYEQDFNDIENVSEFNFASNPYHMWAIGTAENNPVEGETEGGALYVSTDGGLTSGFDTLEYTIAHSSLNVAFGTAAGFEFSFDWKAGGGAYDYFFVSMIPYGQEVNDYYLEDYIISEPMRGSSSWSRATIQIPSSYCNGLYEIVFVWYSYGEYANSMMPGPAVDNIEFVALNCAPVASITATSAEGETEGDPITISVQKSDNNEGVTYVLRYKELDEAVWTIIEDLTSEDFPYIISQGLQHSSAYEIGVAVICSEDDAEDPVYTSTTVATPCGAFATPWSELFDTNPFVSECWERKSGALPATGTISSSALQSSTAWGFDDSRELNGSVSGRLRANIYSTNQTSWVITPSVELAEGTTYQLAFDIAATAYGSTSAPNAMTDDRLVVMYSTDNGLTWDAANGITFADGDSDTEHNISSLTNIPARYFVSLVDQDENPISGVVRFAFYAESVVYGGDNDWFIDNIVVEEYSDCQAPFSVSVSDITYNSANVTFSYVEGGTMFEYAVVEGTNAEITSATGTISAEDLPLQLMGLESSTDYTLAIRMACDGGTYSSWSIPVNFRTWAAPVTIPYTTSFSDPAEEWYFTSSNDNQWFIGSAIHADQAETGYSAYISDDNGATHSAMYSPYYYTYAFMYKDVYFGEDESVAYNLEFDYKGLGNVSGNDVTGGLVVYLLDTDPIVAENGLPNVPELGAFVSAANWESGALEITGVTGTKRLVFCSFGYTTAAETSVPSAVDNISITVSTCARPQELSVSEITTNSAEVAWEAEAEGYIISYRAETETEYTTVTTTSSPYTLTDLTAATRYIVKVQSICGTNTSINTAPVSFMTNCFDDAISTFPWTEGFEEGLDCWRQEYVSGGLTWTIETQAYNTTAAEGTQCAGFIPYNSSVAVTRLISPMLDLTSLNNPTLTFKHMQPEYYGDIDELSVYYKTSENAEPVLLVAYTNNLATWQTATFQLTDVSSNFQLIFEGNSNYGYGIFLDDITITGDQVENPDPEPCAAPTNLAVSAITQTSATVSWTGTATSYEIKLNGGTAETVTATTKTYTDLTAETAYTVEVRAVCAESQSAWVSVPFTTLPSEVVVTPPTVETAAATNVTHEAATLNGSVTAGTETVTAQGFEYQAQGATEWISVTVTGATLTTTLSGLTAETTYNYKAFATTASGNTYGAQMTFTTTAAPVEVVAPTVTTLAATEITVNGATLNGTITAGNEEITSQGFMYQAEGAAEWTTAEVEGENITLALTDLTAATTYSYKAFAITASGTVEGAVMNFTTLAGLADVANNGINAMLYPNPASDKATLSIEGLTSEAQIVVSDAQGRILFNDTLNANTKTYELNVENYAAGVYYVRIISGQSISTQKLIVR